MKLTRRELAAGMASALAYGQTPAPPPPSPAVDLQKAQDQVKANAASLAQMEVPMSTEPAFSFKA